MKKAIFILIMCFCPFVSAANVDKVNIIQIELAKDYGDYVFIKLDIPVVKTGCHINTYWNYTLPLATETDKAIFTMLLSAHMSGKKIGIRGTGSCSQFGSIESAKSIRVY